jgi:hypothetical protein
MEHLWSTAIDASWRGYPAAALALAGLALMARGLWFGAVGRPGLLRQGRDAYAWIRCFQYAVGGMNVIFLAAAWAWRLEWLAILAVAFLGEEMIETSRILTALDRHTRRSATHHPGPSAVAPNRAPLRSS